MKRVFLNHGEAYGNLGDEAMLLCAINRIRNRVNEVEFVVPRSHGAPLPEIGSFREIPSPNQALLRVLKPIFFNSLGRRIDDLPYHQLPLVFARLMITLGRVKEWSIFIKELRACDAVYCVGAANLNDYARYGHLLPKYMLIEEAFRSGIPCIVSSQTVGPLTKTWTQKLAARAFKMSDFFSVRDGGISQRVLAEAGLNHDQIPLSGDEAFSLQAAPEVDALEYLRHQKIDPAKPFGLLHFRSTDYTKSTQGHYQKLARALDEAMLNAQILFIPMSYWTHSGSDYECGKSIKSLMLHPEKLHLLKPTKNVYIIRRLAEMASWLMALSYHVQVFALAAAKPVAILSSGAYYGVKAEGMRMLLDQATSVLDMDHISFQDITFALQELETCSSNRILLMERARSRVQRINDLPIKAIERLLG